MFASTAFRRPGRAAAVAVLAATMSPLVGCSSLGGAKPSVFSASRSDAKTAEAIRLAAADSEPKPIIQTAAASFDAAPKSSTHVADLIDSADRAMAGQDLADARTTYEQVLTLAPQEVHAHHRLGVIADVEQRFADAERHYSTALRLDPRSSKVLSDLGYSYILQGRLEEAEPKLTAARAANPSNMNAAANLALLYAHTGEREKCVALSRLLGPESQAETTAASLFAQAGREFNTDTQVATTEASKPAAVSTPPVEITKDQTAAAPANEGTLTLGDSPFQPNGQQPERLIDLVAPEAGGTPSPFEGAVEFDSQVASANPFPMTTNQRVDATPASFGGALPLVQSGDPNAQPSVQSQIDRRQAAVIGMHTGLGGLFGRYAVGPNPTPPATSVMPTQTAALPPANDPAPMVAPAPQARSQMQTTPGGFIEPPPYNGGGNAAAPLAPLPASPQSNYATAAPPWPPQPAATRTPSGYNAGPAQPFGALPTVTPRQ